MPEPSRDRDKHVRKPYVLALAALIACAAPLSAQKLAPGPALPSNTGGIGPGSTPIAPGPAGGPLIQQQGPGTVPLAIGSPPVAEPNLHRGHRARHERYHGRYGYATTPHHVR